MLNSRDTWRRPFRTAGAVVLGAAFLLIGSGCVVATTYVHRTLEGQQFPVERLSELRPGLSAQEVVTLLGQPLTTREEGDRIIWRYLERAHPKWCDGGDRHQVRPEYRVEAVLSFRAGLLERSEIAREGI
jgi:outer membrane protein assembly factor BamE (lipoprotein component of BamABCDE complex)